MQQNFVDFRSLDRKSGQANDFILEMPQTIKKRKTNSIGFSNLELPSVRYTVEEKENALALSEGICIGDSSMNTYVLHNNVKVFENQIVLIDENNNETILTIPATLMPTTIEPESFLYNDDGSVNNVLTALKTQVPHGLKNFHKWLNANNINNISTILVGAEVHPRASHIFRAGVQIKDLPALNLEEENFIRCSLYTVKSLRVGTNNVGFVYCPPLHLQEIISLLNFQTSNYKFYLNNDTQHTSRSIVNVTHTQGKKFKFYGVKSTQSILSVLGLSENAPFLHTHYAQRNPSIMRIRIPPGFYQSPPSLIANAVERGIQGRCALLPSQETIDGHTFQISILDATYNQTIVVPPGVYTPEKLVDTIQTLLTDVDLTLNHVSENEYENVGWLRYTFSTSSLFPFVLDFSGKRSSSLAFALGFENRRYTNKTSYSGVSIAVAASRNVAPCPPISYTDTVGLRAPLNRSRRDSPRYPHGLYTIVGTSPSTQRFQLICEPGKSWAVPNKNKEKTFFNNVDNAGIVDLSTRALPKQQSYDFREGDVCRLTGYHKHEQTFSISAQSVNGPTGKSEVTSVQSDVIGGRGYSFDPPVQLNGELTDPKEFQVTHIVNQPSTLQQLLGISTVFSPILNAIGTKLPTARLVSISCVITNNSIFDVSYDNVEIEVEEITNAAHNPMFTYSGTTQTPSPGQFRYNQQENSIEIAMDYNTPYIGEATNGNTIDVNVRFNVLQGELSYDLQNTNPFTINTTRGELTFSPTQIEGNKFMFTTNDFSLVNTTGHNDNHDGYVNVNIGERRPYVYQLLRQEIGNDLTFDENNLHILTAKITSLDVAEYQMRMTTPESFKRLNPLITEDNVKPFMFLIQNKEYNFVAAYASLFNSTINETVDGFFTPTTVGEYSYMFQTVPKTLGIVNNVHPEYNGEYSLASKSYNSFVYENGTYSIYLIENNNIYSWKIALVNQTLQYANPTHVYYGKGNSIKNDMTKNERFVSATANDFSYYFSQQNDITGKISVLPQSSIYSKEFNVKCLRKFGMLHPSIQPVRMNDRIICFNVEKTEARYFYPPTIHIGSPEQKPLESDALSVETNTIVSVDTVVVENPKRLMFTSYVNTFPPELDKNNIGSYGYAATILFEDNATRSFLIVDAEKASKKIVFMKDFYEIVQPDWTTKMKSLRISPGRAIHINHTTLTNANNYIMPVMPDLVCRQEFWGQDMPLQYNNVVPIQQNFTENIRSIAINGTVTTFDTDIAYNVTNPSTLTIKRMFASSKIPALQIVSDGQVLSIVLENLNNVYIDDYVSIENVVSNKRIVSIDSATSSIQIDYDASQSTDYWHQGTFDLEENTNLIIDTRRCILNGIFNSNDINRNAIIYLQGSTENSTQSETEIITGFYSVQRYTHFMTNGSESQLFINYVHKQDNNLEGTGEQITVSNASIALSGQQAVDWSMYTDNGIRLSNNPSLNGMQRILSFDQQMAKIKLSTDMIPSEIIGQTVTSMTNGSILITKISKNNLPPLVQGEKIYISGSNSFVQQGPYTGQQSLSFGHSCHRAFDGVWTVKTNEVNNAFEIEYDSNFASGEYVDPNPGDLSSAIPTAYSRPLVSRISALGNHDFSESVFLGGYDILNDNKTWKLRIFNTADPNSAGITNIGVGGFISYNPKPEKGHAIVRVSGDFKNYRIEDVVPAVPGFVAKHDDPSTTEADIITPPVKIGYAEGITSQLNTNFTGSTPPQGHAKVDANIEDGHVIPNNLLPSGARIEGKDKDGREVVYNIAVAYVPGRITYDSLGNNAQPRHLLNTHRLRLVLSDAHDVRLHGEFTIKGAPLINGVYNRPESIFVSGTVNANGSIICTGDTLPTLGYRVTSTDIEDGKVVGNVVDNGDGTFTVQMWPSGSIFEGETTIEFENVDQTIAYTHPVPETNSYVPVPNSNLGSEIDSVKGKWVRVPTEGTKSSQGETIPTYNNNWYLIAPRIVNQEIEITAGLHTTAYAALPNAVNTPTNFYDHVPYSVSNVITNQTHIASWGPISYGLTDNILSVPTICFPGSQQTYYFSDMNISFGGDYTTDPTVQFHADASMMVVSENQTKIGIVTLSEFDAFNKFRLIFEYNCNGLNGDKGFNDTTKDGQIFFTFSRVFEPRLELLPEHTDAMAVFGSNRKINDMPFAYDIRNNDWPDTFNGASSNGHALLPRQRQQIARLIGATKNVFGQSAYILPSQWNIDPQPYRLLIIEPYKEPVTAHLTLCSEVSDESSGVVALGDRVDNGQIFMKIVLPNAYNVPGPQPRQLSVSPASNIERLRIRVLDFDLTPHPMHGREMSISLVFDGGKLVGRRNP